MAASDVASAVQLIGMFLVQEATTLYGVEEQVQGLQEELEILQQYLHDADARQEKREVCALVRQIRKLAYDAEDVIDTYILKVHKSDGTWFTRFATFLYKFPQVYEVRQQVQVIQTSLKRVSDKLNSYGLRRITNMDTSLISRNERYRRQRPRSYPYDDSDGEFVVVGMEEDIKKLVDVVMGEGGTHVGVVCIVGMGGSGKTTLARNLYNHPYVKECFDCRAWVYISQEWSTQHVLLEILRKVGGLKLTTLQGTFTVEELVDKLRDILEKKSYLVVLDDVWRREALEEIFPALPRGQHINKGSKIIITARNREIFQSRISQQEHLYILEPQPLTEKSSWELFSKIALSHRTSYEEESFKNVGKEMVKVCNGLPLAVVALAGILNTRRTIGEWQHVAEAARSRILDGTCSNMYGRVGELLAMSYDDLPYDLKPCFLYLGVFPEDCQIPVGMLTRMWIAEGLVSTRYTDMSLEDVALQRLGELSHRFMIQVVKTNFNGAIKAFRLHDLLRDLCVQKAKEQSFLHIYTPLSVPGSSHMSMSEIQPRRAALHSSTCLPAQVSHLRSLVLLSQSSVSHSAYNCKETFDVQFVPKNFKLLRLLSIWGIKTASGTLPMQIGSLIHLRYLEIRATNITGLPSSIGCLRNLLTLDYRDVDLENNVPIDIPNVFQKLVQLRNLFLPIEYPWKADKLWLSTMRNLRTLWGLRLDNKSNFLLKDVPKLSTTLKKLKIAVSGENELKAAFCCPSLMTDALLTLHCELRGGISLCNVEPLRNRQHLLKLTLIGEIQMKLSLILPMNVVMLEFRDSMIEDEDPMAALGALAHLKRLILSNAFSSTTFSCRSGSFPQLEELDIESLSSLDTWDIEKGAMPCLKKLEITRCWCLRKFPQGLMFVRTLQLFDFFDMPLTFCKTAREIGWASQKLRLPHNFAAIIELSDVRIDSSSIRKLYEQLAVGIFLDNKTKKYWVTNHHGNYYNCFMVYASSLCLASERLLDVINLDIQYENINLYVECKEVLENSGNGTTVTVAKVSSLLSLLYAEVIGKFDPGNLSMEVTYEINWVIMLDKSDTSKKKYSTSFVDEVDGATVFHTKLNGLHIHTEEIYYKRINEWIHIPGGVYERHPKMDEEVELSLSYQEGFHQLDPIIKGFIIQPNFVTSRAPVRNHGIDLKSIQYSSLNMNSGVLLKPAT